MRTTVTIDPDVQALLRDAMQQTGQGFKTTLNEAVRRGLADMLPRIKEPPFVVRPKDMGLRPGIDPARLQEFADELEVDAFLELTEKLQQRLRPTTNP